MFKDPSFEWHNENYEFQLLTHNTSDIIDFLAPGMFINENTALNIKIDETGLFDGSLQSGRIAKGNNYAKNIDAVITNADSTLRADINIGEVELAKMVAEGNSLAVTAQKDSLSIGLAYGGISENRGNILLHGRLERNIAATEIKNSAIVNFFEFIFERFGINSFIILTPNL